MSLERRFSVNGTGKSRGELTLSERERKVDQALTSKYDQLAERWADAERYFCNQHLPCPIFVAFNESRLHPQQDPGSQTWDCLAFRRHQGKWRLCFARCQGHQAEDGVEPAWKPITECSTDVRVEAAAQLGKLMAEAAKAKEEYISKVGEAIGQIDSFLEASSSDK